METLEVKGFPVEIHTAGSGPPLLYLHAEQYVEQVRPYLDTLAKKWTVIAPRHPGYGAASVATDFRSVDDLAYLYLDLLDELKLDNVVLVGASLGGWIALEMCVRNHTRLSKLVLVSSVGVKFSGREERATRRSCHKWLAMMTCVANAAEQRSTKVNTLKSRFVGLILNLLA